MEKLKILIAEDDKFVRELYKDGISEEKYDVRYVTNGKDALDSCESWSPDIIVLDIVMPVMTGFEALKKLKELKEKEQFHKRQAGKDEGRSPVIIMATAMDTEEDIMDCIKLGIDGYIVKPIKWQEIEGQIMEYYKRASAE